MSNQHFVAARAMGSVLLICLALFCGFGFLASFEGEFPNAFHALYGIVGVAALAGATWLLWPALKLMLTGSADPHWASYWRPIRLAALFSLFSVLALTTGSFAYFAFLLFLLFLLPAPTVRRAQP